MLTVWRCITGACYYFYYFEPTWLNYKNHFIVCFPVERNYIYFAYREHFPFCLSVVHIKYTPFLHNQKDSTLCDPADNIYCRIGSFSNITYKVIQ